MAVGAYAVERDYSHYVASLSGTVLAVVGTATKGPIGVPTLCTSAQDLVNKFGPLKTDCYGLYAGQYFLSQSSRMYFVRAASSTAAEAKAMIEGTNTAGTALADAITLSLLDKGTAGNGYILAITEENSKYTMTLRTPAGIIVESLKDVAIEDLILGYQTNYYRVSAVDSTATSLTTGSYSFSGGNDGITDITPADYITAGNTLLPESINMDIFAIPGVSDSSVITAMLALAESRGDCLYLVDPPKGLTTEGVMKWHNGGGEYEHAAFNSSYGALYYDWVNIYDSINKVKVQVPPSVVVAATYAYSDRSSNLWFAPAGLNRGIVRGALDSATKLSKADTAILHDGQNNINSIYEDPQVGLVLWGQKTLLRSESALDRVNVRRLLNYLKRVVSAACDYLVYEPNDRITWNRFEMMLKPILENIKSHRGIYDYQIVRGESIVTAEDIDNYKMPCMVTVRPAKAAEEIPIYFVITSTGADFNDVLEANGVI